MQLRHVRGATEEGPLAHLVVSAVGTCSLVPCWLSVNQFQKGPAFTYHIYIYSATYRGSNLFSPTELFSRTKLTTGKPDHAASSECRQANGQQAGIIAVPMIHYRPNH